MSAVDAAPKVKRGRPPGAHLARRTRRIAEIAALRGATPLQVMLKVMEHHIENKDLDKAHMVAKDAAPYIHPRLAAVAHVSQNVNGLDTFSLEELGQLRRALQAVEAGPLIEHAPQLSADNNDPLFD